MTGKIKVHVALEAAAAGDLQVIMRNIGQGALAGFELAGISWTGSQIREGVEQHEADALILSPRIPGYDSSVIPCLYHHPKKPVVTIALVSQENRDWAAEMERLGAVGHLISPLTDEQLARLAEIVPAAISRAWQERQSPRYVPRLSLEEAMVADRYGWQKQSLAVWSASGGQGKTTLAVNIAAILSTIAGKRTLLIDADMNKSDCHLLVDVPMGPKNIYALAQRYHADRARTNGQMEHATFRGFVVERRFSKSPVPLHFIPGIPQPWMAADDVLVGPDGKMGSAFMRALLERAEQEYDFVVVDLGQSVAHPVHWSTLQMADTIIAVCTTARTSINNLQKGLELLKRKMSLEKVRVVMNQTHPRHGVTPAQVQKALGFPVLVEIPMAEEEEAVIALNSGIPLVLYNIENPASQAIITLTITLYPALAEILHRAGWVNRKPRFRFLRG